jgi:hypothetical protein
MLRRIAVVLALTIPATAGVIAAGAAQDAWACSDSNGANHCYAVAYVNTGVNYGAFGYINLHCQYQPNNANFATNEIWDVNSSNAYWIEDGVISGNDFGTYFARHWFWADSRPGGGFNFHAPSNLQEANNNTNYAVEIYYVGSHTWTVQGANGDVILGNSTNQTYIPNFLESGTEYLGASNSGIRNIGHVSSLEHEDTSNNWYYWGTDGYTAGAGGPGAYIQPSYNQTSSTTSWSGPC